MKRIRAAIVSDKAIFRHGIQALLAMHPDVELVAALATTQQCIEKLHERPADAIVLEATSVSPDDCVAAVTELKKAFPDCGLVVLTSDPDADCASRVLGAGAEAYVLLKSSETELIRALRAVVEGQSYLDGHIGGEALRRRLVLRGSSGDRSVDLSSREWEVLRLIASGRTHREVAELLKVSAKSVETYRGRAARKLGLRSRAELVDYAVKHGLLESSEGEEQK